LAEAINNANKAWNKRLSEGDRIVRGRVAAELSPENHRLINNLNSEYSRKTAIVDSIHKKLFGNSPIRYNLPTRENAAKMVISKHAPSFLNKARQHHFKWLKNMLIAGKSNKEINAALNKKYKTNIYNPRPSPRRNSPRRQNPFRPNSVRQSESRAIARRQAQHGPSNNTHITWSRNANGKINIHKTLRNLEFSLTNKQKKTLENMPENQAVKALRWFAREAQLR
jgi:hypothetical protein